MKAASYLVFGDIGSWCCHLGLLVLGKLSYTIRCHSTNIFQIENNLFDRLETMIIGYKDLCTLETTDT